MTFDTDTVPKLDQFAKQDLCTLRKMSLVDPPNVFASASTTKKIEKVQTAHTDSVKLFTLEVSDYQG